MELHRPNKETVRSLIVNSIEGILSKPPYFSKEIVSTIVVDLEASKEFLEEDNNKLKHYLESRFLSKMMPNVELEVFRALWKFVFKLENEKANSNRNINFLALSYLFEKHKIKALELMNKESDYYSDISKEEKNISYLIKFLSLNSEAYKTLSDSAKILIEKLTDNNERDFFKSNFLYKTLSEFHDNLLKYIVEDEGRLKKSDLKHLHKLSDSPEWRTKIRILRNAYYGQSGSFATAENQIL